MVELTVSDLAGAVGAIVTAVPAAANVAGLRARAFRAVALDSRRVAPGDLFIALPGSRGHGAAYAGDAIARGALAVLTPEPPVLTAAQLAAREPAAPAAVLLVPDSLAALQRAAAAWRTRFPAVTVIGVTGSVGKTTTREVIASVLAPAIPTLASERSYNNEIGLPVTLLALERAHRAAVLELAMYARGEIAALAAMAAPRIGVVTMVAPVHLDRLGSLEAIAQAKAELVQALPSDGAAILNGDDPRVRSMAGLTAARAVTFGLEEGNDWRAEDIVDRGLDGLCLMVRNGSWSERVESPVVGRHFIHALLAAAAVGDVMGVPRESLAALLAGARITERQRFLRGPRDLLIIDDSWNASEPSMLAALGVLATVRRRRVAVLGEMLELGETSDAAHRAVGRRAAAVVQALVAVGAGGKIMAEEARHAGRGAGITVVAVDSGAEATGALRALLRPGDVVLVKGSRGLHLEETAQWLTSDMDGEGSRAG